MNAFLFIYLFHPIRNALMIFHTQATAVADRFLKKSEEKSNSFHLVFVCYKYEIGFFPSFSTKMEALREVVHGKSNFFG